jgi:hyperosmotically inducible protein
MKLQRTTSALAIAAMVALGVPGCAAFHTGKEKTDTSSNPRGPVATTVDATINAKVKTALAADSMVKARNIDVDTVRGVVTLNGMVNSAAEKAQAIRLARGIEGVVEVKDNLKMGG